MRGTLESSMRRLPSSHRPMHSGVTWSASATWAWSRWSSSRRRRSRIFSGTGVAVVVVECEFIKDDSVDFRFGKQERTWLAPARAVGGCHLWGWLVLLLGTGGGLGGTCAGARITRHRCWPRLFE